ncbi:hypothetical protein HZA42_05700 [Candidatus Peregrinibacteria bacterium]|nr:hypothetical protein [Candidatus Peregrinibacteria bacterium]
MKNKFIWLPVALIAVAVVGVAVWFGNTQIQKGSIFSGKQENKAYVIPNISNKVADVSISAGVNGYPQHPDALLPNAYINMYKVTSFAKDQRGDYANGNLAATDQTGSNGSGATFTVKQGDMVYFIGFRSKDAAVNDKQRTFYYSPYKNFFPFGPASKLCQPSSFTNLNDIAKHSDGTLSCTNSISMPAVDSIDVGSPR